MSYKTFYLNRRKGRVWQVPVQLIGGRLRATQHVPAYGYQTAEDIVNEMNQILAQRGTPGKCFTVWQG